MASKAIKALGAPRSDKTKKQQPRSRSRVPDGAARYVLTEKQLEINGFPRPAKEPGKCKIFKYDGNVGTEKQWSPKKTCRLCQKEFTLSKNGDFELEEECRHHWGQKLYRMNIYSCCKRHIGSEGCTIGKTHVHDDNRSYWDDYVQTIKKGGTNRDIYAVDCEMSYTVNGLELIRVSVVDMDCDVVMDHLVRPNGRVLNYNTRWSGVTEEDLIGVKKTLCDIQEEFLEKFSSETIFLGHSLESDLKALRIIHSSVIDTSVVFPSNRPFPCKRGLRRLVFDKLGINIQDPSAIGHDSTEDAKACIQLLKWKMRLDSRGRYGLSRAARHYDI